MKRKVLPGSIITRNVMFDLVFVNGEAVRKTHHKTLMGMIGIIKIRFDTNTVTFAVREKILGAIGSKGQHNILERSFELL